MQESSVNCTTETQAKDHHELIREVGPASNGIARQTRRGFSASGSVPRERHTQP